MPAGADGGGVVPVRDVVDRCGAGGAQDRSEQVDVAEVGEQSGAVQRPGGLFRCEVRVFGAVERVGQGVSIEGGPSEVDLSGSGFVLVGVVVGEDHRRICSTGTMTRPAAARASRIRSAIQPSVTGSSG
jgi:hypothetical protein